MRIPHSSRKEKRPSLIAVPDPVEVRMDGVVMREQAFRWVLPRGLPNIPQKSIKIHKARSLGAWRSLE